MSWDTVDVDCWQACSRLGRRRGSAPRVGRNDPRTLRPVLIQLENRRLLSTFAVTSTADTASASSPAPNTLRWAVEQANLATSPSTIDFNLGSATPTITLSQGVLTLSNRSEPTTITGPNAGVTISGGGKDQVFQVDGGVTATLSGLTVTGGSSAGNGGGILNDGILAINKSTLTANSAHYGGAVFTSGGSLNIADCTIVSNTAAISGGGIEAQSKVTITSSTCSLNAANSGGGGAIDNFNAGQEVITIEDSILAGDSCVYGPEVANAVVSLGYNLVSNAFESSGWISSDRTGTSASPLSALLGPLGDYGGPNDTMPLLPGSLAIGNGAGLSGVTSDQRGFPLDAPTPDIGAFQSQPGLVVNTTIDGTGSPSGHLSLRQAVNLANQLSPAPPITFDPNVFATSQTITLFSGLLVLSNTNTSANATETVTGPNAGVTISGGGTAQVFQVHGGVTATLSGLTITRGLSSIGGGLTNLGALTLSGCTVSGNYAGTFGGGLYSTGTLTLSDCTVSGNSAGYCGGGLTNLGALTLTGCTVSGNHAGTFGGGLYSTGTLTLSDCTVSGNSAGYCGGGLYSTGTLTLSDCTVSGNSAGLSGGGLYNRGISTLTDCTISGNSARQQGGGLANQHTLKLTDCTVSGNSAVEVGGGLYAPYISTSSTLENTIIAANINGDVGGIPRPAASPARIT